MTSLTDIFPDLTRKFLGVVFVITFIWTLLFMAAVRWRNWASRLSLDHDTLSIDGYVRAKKNTLYWLFSFACWGWCFFYGFLLIDPSLFDSCYKGRWPGFLENLSTNLTSVLLMCFYIELSGTVRHRRTEGHVIGTDVGSWPFLLGAATIFEFVKTFTTPAHTAASPSSGSVILMAFYGLSQAVAIYMIAGRLDSAMISRLLSDRSKRFDTWKLFHRFSIFVAYLYASIQPLYVLIGVNRPSMAFALVLSALIAKVIFMLWIGFLLTHRSGKGRPTPIEYLLYEMDRFAAEEESDFEQTFLRKHFHPIYMKQLKEQEIGYIGIEFTPLSDFKMKWLGLDHSDGGLLVTHVYAGSDAKRKGIRPWDFIVSVNGMPVGRANTLSDVLVGTGVKREVEVELLRRTNIWDSKHDHVQYTHLRLRVILGRYDRMVAPRLLKWNRVGWKINCNSRRGGVLCLARKVEVRVTGIRSEFSSHFYEIPDASMLRMVREQLVAGETVEVRGEQYTRRLTLRPRHVAARTTPRTWSERNTDPKTRKRLTKLYPELFLPLAPPDLGPEMRDHLLFFDSTLAIIFESCGQYATVPSVQEFALWEDLKPGPIHVFSGRRMVDADGVEQWDGAHGKLCTYELGPVPSRENTEAKTSKSQEAAADR